MNTQKMRMAALVLAMGLSGAAQAALQARDLDGNLATFEAYYDTDLNITWLADANYAKTSGYDADGMMDWNTATAWTANLSFTDGVKVYADWRLPTDVPINGVSFEIASPYLENTTGSYDVGYNITRLQNEMAHMFSVTLGNPGYYTLAGAVSGCYVNSNNTCLDNVGPFSNLQPSGYWSAAVPSWAVTYALEYYMNVGWQGLNSKSAGHYAWAVSPGDVAITGVAAAVPEADTWAMLLAGLGLVSFAGRRRAMVK